MTDIIDRLTTPEECEQVAKNVEKTDPSLAIRARRKAVQLRADNHGAKTTAEKEALRAIFAYEECLTKKNGRKTRASRTWPMIKKHGIIKAVEKAVNRKDVTQGYAILAEMGMQDFAFEVVVVRYPELFEQATIDRAKERIAQITSCSTCEAPGIKAMRT